MPTETNPTEEFQSTIIDAVNKAAANAVHPALIYTILGGCQDDVLKSIKQMSQAAKQMSETMAHTTHETTPADQLVKQALDAQENVVPLTHGDSPTNATAN